MSARGQPKPGGAQTRPDLFESARGSGRSARNEQKEDAEMDALDPAARDEELHEMYGAGKMDEDPLQLEHMIGFNGDNKNNVLMLPNTDGSFVKSMGNLIAIENLNDPHDQKILRGHDMQVSAMAVSRCGQMVASGQVGTRNFKGNAAPVFVWDMAIEKRIVALRGLSVRVNLLEFSDDGKFLLGCGEDSLLYVWEIFSGEVVYGQRFDKPVTVIKWCYSFLENRRTSYELAVGYGSNMCKGLFFFDASRVQWTLQLKPFALPSGGLTRFFCSVELSQDKKYLFVGSTGADLLIYRQDLGVYRAMIPVGSNGVRSLLTLPNGDLLCGGGDGTITILRGEDLSWEAIDSVSLGREVMSMSLASNEAEFIVGCASGEVIRCLTTGLTTQVVASCHSSEVTSITFGDTVTFVTGTRGGHIKVWDITDYACLCTRKESNGAVLSLCLLFNDSQVVSGWEDGCIRCHDIELTSQLWYINQAHKLGTTSIAICDDANEKLQYMVSGGGDGAVRIWRLGNRELLNQYSEHAKGISKVLVDNKHSNIVHSASLDCTVLSYDLKISKRLICHMIKGGNITDMTQRWDSEGELVTCDTNGRLLHWDIDVREPVLAVKDAGHMPHLRCCAISPTGNYLAFAGDDSMLKILHVPSSQMVSLGRGHSGVINCLAWTPDEKQIVTGGEDSCMCVWNFYLGGMT